MNEIKQNKRCDYCNTLFRPSRLDKRIKYCSKRCRERDWVENNKARCREFSKRSRDKKLVLCRYCNKEISLEVRKSGLVLCSDKCREKHTNKLRKQDRDKKFKIFREYKETKGCTLCGYNDYGGSLDFHHLKPKDKKIRITATHFVSNSTKIKKEMNKCIIVCKNCHYELHYLMRTNMDNYWKKLKK